MNENISSPSPETTRGLQPERKVDEGKETQKELLARVDRAIDAYWTSQWLPLQTSNCVTHSKAINEALDAVEGKKDEPECKKRLGKLYEAKGFIDLCLSIQGDPDIKEIMYDEKIKSFFTDKEAAKKLMDEGISEDVLEDLQKRLNSSSLTNMMTALENFIKMMSNSQDNPGTPKSVGDMKMYARFALDNLSKIQGRMEDKSMEKAEDLLKDIQGGKNTEE